MPTVVPGISAWRNVVVHRRNVQHGKPESGRFYAHHAIRVCQAFPRMHEL